jgi:RHS repeat-associated protein
VYDAYGVGTSTPPVTSDPFGYEAQAGYSTDPETGLVALAFRYYDPAAGRFLNRDPIGYAGGVNLYGYTAGNPVNGLDPLGLCGPEKDWLWHLSDFSAGFGDGATFGLTRWIRQQMGTDEFVDHGSVLYLGGTLAGAAAGSYVTPTLSSRLIAYLGARSQVARDVLVYESVNANGEVQYAGITNNFARRAAEHIGRFNIQRIPGLSGLTRQEARAVEQVLIEHHGLGRNGGTLLNRINAISKSNPEYAEAIKKGTQLLHNAGYPGF